MAIDEAVLGEFIGKFVTDLGATVAAGNVVVGHRLGLYKTLATGPASAQSWPSARVPYRAMSRSGCAGRQRADTSNTTRTPRRTR